MAVLYGPLKNRGTDFMTLALSSNSSVKFTTSKLWNAPLNVAAPGRRKMCLLLNHIVRRNVEAILMMLRLLLRGHPDGGN